ncbi:MAG: T9SS type A sorting domain-containing protein [Spirosomataceae bacterium]
MITEPLTKGFEPLRGLLTFLAGAVKKLIALFLIIPFDGFSQNNPPWERPLKIAWSNDGITFTNTAVFQDSSGVPGAVQWKGDTLVCVFQWFRQPLNSPTWDRVAIKFSYDSGRSWTPPTPIKINGLPANYQRPFDPTLAVINKDSLRLYFSSSNGLPMGGLDNSVDTYSAVSTNGLTYTFEPKARYDDAAQAVIDPAVIYFNGVWHYAAPAGAPQEGAFHGSGKDGLNFTAHPKYPSDNTHNWTGNFMVNTAAELRFYGSGPQIWYNSSTDGFAWQGYTNTNIRGGGDPSVVKLGTQSYLIIYVGESYTSGSGTITGIQKSSFSAGPFHVAPNPFTHTIHLIQATGQEQYRLVNSLGQLLWSGRHCEQKDFSYLPNGFYFLVVTTERVTQIIKLIKQ